MYVKSSTRWLFLAPVLIFIVLLVIYPTIDLFWMSLSKAGLEAPSVRPFAGFSNFARFFRDPVALNSLKYTFIFIVCTILIQLVLGLVLATLLDSHLITRGKTLFRSLLLVPLAIAPVIVALFWRILLHNQLGIINYFIGFIGMKPIMWWGNLSLTPFTLIIIDTWQWTPFFILILLGGLRSISTSLREAASVDGASSFQLFRYIKFPLLTKYMLIGVILRIPLAQKRVFDLVAVTTGGGPGRVTETLNLRIYKSLFSSFDLGYTGALSVVLLLIMVISLQPFARKLWK